ncbi:MAG: CBS domain-containing protein [Chloroflexi bacterium]|nr:CBS domain-containing protein [Chloroflexota bacterium]
MAKVEDIMTSNVASVVPSAPIVEVALKMRESGLGMMPVCENGKLRGMISERSIISNVVAFARNPKREHARTLMYNGGPRIQPGCDIVEAAKLMAIHHVHCLPVVQNGGQLAGLLTLNDIIKENPMLASMVLAKVDASTGHSNGTRKKPEP